MPNQRLRGQETIVTILANGDVQSKISAIKDCEITFKLEVKVEQYLGETAPRPDMIYMGCQVKLTGHLDNKQFFKLVKVIVERARRQSGPGTRIDIGCTFRFDNGEIVTCIFPDLSFADIPLNIGGRDEYGEWTLDGTGGDFTIVG
jgi:hypothetical protein